MPKVRTEGGKKSIKYAGAKIWNQLSDNVKLNTETKSFHICRKAIKAYMLSKY